MNPADLLLSWLTDRERVSAAVLQRGCDHLCRRFAGSDVIRELSRQRIWKRSLVYHLLRLGHVERGADGSVSVCPPTLIMMSNGEAHWYGARTPGLQEEFRKCGLKINKERQTRIPALFRVVGTPGAIEEAASQCECRLQWERGMEVLRSLIPLSQLLDGCRTSSDVCSQEWECYVPDAKRAPQWKKAREFEAGNLYQQPHSHPRRFCWITRDRDKVRIEPGIQLEAAQWQAVLCHARLFYDPTRQELSILAAPRLPILVERPLLLASGLDTRREKGRGRVYCSITLQRATEVARIVGINLTIQK